MVWFRPVCWRTECVFPPLVLSVKFMVGTGRVVLWEICREGTTDAVGGRLWSGCHQVRWRTECVFLPLMLLVAFGALMHAVGL